MSEDLIRMEHIDKFYGRVQALDDVNFNVTRQEIVGLLGDNGAGKSTLIKVLSGAVRATSGDIIVRGKRADIRSTTDAIALGIETIYQDSALVTQLSIARNLFLGREPLKGPRFLNRMDTALMERGRRRAPAEGRNRQVDPGLDADLVAVRRRAAGGGDRPRDAFRQRPHHPRRADQQPWRRGDAGRAALRAQRARFRSLLHPDRA